MNDLPTIYDNVQDAIDAAGAPTDVVKVAGACGGVNTRGGKKQVAYIDRNLTLRGGYTKSDWSNSDPLAHPSTISAEGFGRTIFITGGVNPTIENLTIRGGNSAGLGGSEWDKDAGGGIYSHESSPLITDCTIRNNTSPYEGGGVYLRKGPAVVDGQPASPPTRPTEAVRCSRGRASPCWRKLLHGEPASGDWPTGGGILLDEADSRLSNNTLSENTVHAADQRGRGRRLATEYGKLTAVGNILTSNTASVASNYQQANGAGARVKQTVLAFVDNEVLGNSCVNADVGGGAGMRVTGLRRRRSCATPSRTPSALRVGLGPRGSRRSGPVQLQFGRLRLQPCDIQHGALHGWHERVRLLKCPYLQQHRGRQCRPEGECGGMSLGNGNVSLWNNTIARNGDMAVMVNYGGDGQEQHHRRAWVWRQGAGRGRVRRARRHPLGHRRVGEHHRDTGQCDHRSRGPARRPAV